MATPIRMAPVLYGKEAEFFFEQWAKMRAKPAKRPLTENFLSKYDKFMAKQNVK